MSASKFATAAVALLSASQATAHMIMAYPVPFGNPDNSPLSSSGTDFPCKLTGSPSTFYTTTSGTSSNNTMAIGETKQLSFTGSATHGGGSCQLAITSDKQPSNSTAWQVIQSIEGGCPSTGADGTNPSTYDFQIPASVATGDYVFAWTWISKEAGQPEYYMNCAPITVTAAKSKRDQEAAERLAARGSSLPNLFVANLGSNINSCKTVPETDPLYPDPGPNVVKPGVKPNYQAVNGTDCFPIGGTSSGGSSSASAGTDAASSTTSAAASAGTGSGATGVFATTGATTSAASAPDSTSSVDFGGVFRTVTTSSTGGAGGASSTGAAGAASSSPATTTAVASGSTSSSAASVSAAPQVSSSTNGTSVGESGACTSEGTFNCVGGSQYQQCASGTWTALQAMPAGTTCKEGESTTLWARDGTARRMRRVRRSY